MLELLSRLARHVPTLLESTGALLIGYGIWLQWGPVAFMWAGLACFGLSFTIETRRRGGTRGASTT